MKSRRAKLEIFNLSFLDIVSCGFGAVVLLVLISKPLEAPISLDIDQTNTLLTQVMVAKDQLATSSQLRDKKQRELVSLKQINNMIEQSQADIQSQLADKTRQLERLDGDLNGLSLVQASLERSSIKPSSSTIRDAEVGGIPVDSDYIIFIVDTSGSMLKIWPRVLQELTNVLKIHPRVKGFQIMNDNGTHLISSYVGKWIPDTPLRRKAVMRMFQTWRSASNSSPIEGLQIALKRYAKPNKSISIYIFGDDYSGASYGPVIDVIDKQNRNKITGKRLVKIHAIGFMSQYTTNRFPILMREITKRNGGTFLALRP